MTIALFGVVDRAAPIALLRSRCSVLTVTLQCRASVDRSFKEMCDAYRDAKRCLGEVLSAVEFVDRPALDAVVETHPGSRDPFSQPFPFYMFIETSGR